MTENEIAEFSLPKIILASGSPRRAEILQSVGWKFEKMTADIDESVAEDENPRDYVRRLAREKAEAVAADNPEKIVLGADTTVVINNRIIGKPADFKEAAEMLKTLSGNWHEVLTGIALVKKSSSGASKVLVNLQSTRVKFAEISESETDFLVRFGNPLDKAGAYAVQAQAALFIEKIEGDYWNVVGLPVNLLYKTFQEFLLTEPK